jgi:predicted RNA-binding protein YlqC (UPF0109 family)
MTCNWLTVNDNNIIALLQPESTDRTRWIIGLIISAQSNASEKEGDGAMKDLIVQIAQALVDNPEQVSVNVLEGSQATVLELAVAKEDLGKIIGKQGRTARAIRTILSAASAKQRKRAVLEIVE